MPALAGVLLGIMSVGSALGGLAYGSRGLAPAARAAVRRDARADGAGLALWLCRWHPWLFAPWCRRSAGVAMAPALIIQSMLVAKISRAGALDRSIHLV